VIGLTFAARQRRALPEIECMLRRTDPCLAPAFGMFSRLAADEEMPSAERVMSGRARRRRRHDPGRPDAVAPARAAVPGGRHPNRRGIEMGERNGAATPHRRPGSGLAGGEGQQMKIVSRRWWLMTVPAKMQKEKQCAF